MSDKNKVRDDDAVTPEESPDSFDVSRRRLRRRWELASVLHFLTVFESVLGKDLKMSAEEIEVALITPNAQLAKLHVTLLKGIPPVNKHLTNPDVWVTILCKKLAEWWPWVAEGEIPLTAAKGEEIPKYKELDPTIRLLMLKALCELRTEQDDLMSYINDSLKEGKQPDHFRKDKICEDEAGISYWYDGSSVIGHRLYKEVNKSLVKPKHKGKGCSSPPGNMEWETLATNLDEFREVLEQFSSHKFGVETMVRDTIETEIIPALEEVEKKKERALKRQQRQESLLNGYQSFAVGVTRSSRARRPVTYTFAEYDRVIDEALKSTRKRKDRVVEKHDRKEQRLRQMRKRGNVSSDGDSEKDAPSEEQSSASSDKEGEDEDEEIEEDTKNSNNSEENDSDKENEVKNSNSSNENDTDNEDETNNSNNSEGNDSDKENEAKNSNSCEEKDTDNETETKNSNSSAEIDSDKNESEEEENSESKSSEYNTEKGKSNGRNDEKIVSKKSSWNSARGAYHCNGESRNMGAKNRVRQRPTRNTAIESDNDSGNESSSESSDSGEDQDEEHESPAVSDFEDEVQS